MTKRPSPGDLLDGCVLFVGLPHPRPPNTGDAWLLVEGKLVHAVLHTNFASPWSLERLTALRGRPDLPSHRLRFDPTWMPGLASLWKLAWGER